MAPTEKLKIVYFGTPHFAVAGLEALLDAGYDVVAVVTSPDKPAGRGLQMMESPVKEFAKRRGIKVLQPEKLKSDEFYESLQSIQPNLMIVVAFRMLPERIWNFPKYGTFNLHASLLPKYRGAAPINHAIMNGDKETGITTFFLKHEIDTGDIAFQEKYKIKEDETAGSLHDVLMEKGKHLIVKTVKALENGTLMLQNQVGEATHAPKIFKQDCFVDFKLTSTQTLNKIRGLSPYPTAFACFLQNGNLQQIKIFDAAITEMPENFHTGKIVTDNKTYVKVKCADKGILLKEVQLQGKKRMAITEFLRGFHAEKIQNFLSEFPNNKGKE